MYKIPQDNAVQEEMLETVRSSVEMLRGVAGFSRGVAGFSVVDTERPGSAIEPHGGIQDDMQLDKVLIRMRASSLDAYGGKLIIVCTKPDEEWRIARLTSVRGVAPTFVDERVFSDEQDAQAEVFRMRLEEFPSGSKSSRRRMGCLSTSTRATSGPGPTTGGRCEHLERLDAPHCIRRQVDGAAGRNPQLPRQL